MRAPPRPCSKAPNNPEPGFGAPLGNPFRTISNLTGMRFSSFCTFCWVARSRKRDQLTFCAFCCCLGACLGKGGAGSVHQKSGTPTLFLGRVRSSKIIGGWWVPPLGWRGLTLEKDPLRKHIYPPLWRNPAAELVTPSRWRFLRLQLIKCLSTLSSAAGGVVPVGVGHPFREKGLSNSRFPANF